MSCRHRNHAARPTAGSGDFPRPDVIAVAGETQHFLTIAVAGETQNYLTIAVARANVAENAYTAEFR